MKKETKQHPVMTSNDIMFLYIQLIADLLAAGASRYLIKVLGLALYLLLCRMQTIYRSMYK